MDVFRILGFVSRTNTLHNPSNKPWLSRFHQTWVSGHDEIALHFNPKWRNGFWWVSFGTVQWVSLQLQSLYMLLINMQVKSICIEAFFGKSHQIPILIMQTTFNLSWTWANEGSPGIPWRNWAAFSVIRRRLSLLNDPAWRTSAIDLIVEIQRIGQDTNYQADVLWTGSGAGNNHNTKVQGLASSPCSKHHGDQGKYLVEEPNKVYELMFDPNQYSQFHNWKKKKKRA